VFASALLAFFRIDTKHINMQNSKKNGERRQQKRMRRNEWIGRSFCYCRKATKRDRDSLSISFLSSRMCHWCEIRPRSPLYLTLNQTWKQWPYFYYFSVVHGTLLVFASVPPSRARHYCFTYGPYSCTPTDANSTKWRGV